MSVTLAWSVLVNVTTLLLRPLTLPDEKPVKVPVMCVPAAIEAPSAWLANAVATSVAEAPPAGAV